MDSFSWSDAARAVFGPCLQCLPSRRPSNEEDEEQQRQGLRGRDELESLLRNPGFSDGEMDTDAVSLHSGIGQPGFGRKKDRRRKKKRKAKGSIRLFGYDLFGRPLHLVENDDSTSQNDIQRRISRLSSSSLDSDAAPLTDDIIPQLSTDQQAREDAEAARRARKALRKQKKLAHLFVPSAEEFDGIPGSGLSPDDFGAFQAAPPPDSAFDAASPSSEPDHGFVQVPRNGADEADASADFDAVSYTRGASRRSDSGSGTRSRTSASASNAPVQKLPAQPHLVPLPPSSAGSSSGPRRKKSRTGKRSTTTGSTDTNSQPRSPTMHTPPPHVGIVSPTWVGHPGQTPELEGVSPDDGFHSSSPRSPASPYKLTGQTVHGERIPVLTSPQGFPSPGFSRPSVFPSSGFGGRKGASSMSGAFLARTGDDA